MALPRQVERSLPIRLDADTVTVRSNFFAARTDRQDVIVVRRASGAIGVHFEIHETPTEGKANAKTVLVWAEDRLYHQLLSRALRSFQVKLPYFEFDYAPYESAP